MKLFLVILILFLLSFTTVNAAPGPTYLVVNDKERTCGEYWTGDEFGQNKFPEGWRIVDEENFYPVVCSELEYSNLNKGCCELLNYEYVDDIYDSKPVDYPVYRKILPIVILVAGITIFGIYVVIKKRHKSIGIQLNMSERGSKAK